MGLFSKLFKPSNKTAEIQVNSPVNKAIEEVKGYSLTYHYEDVEVCVWDGIIPPNTTSNNKIVFIQEKNNKADNRAVLILLVPQKKKLGYIYRGKLQDMINDYLDRGDKVNARISKIEPPPYTSVKIDLAFFKKDA